MSKFMMLLHEDTTSFADASPEDLGAVIAEYTAWRDKQMSAGRFVGGEKLMDEGGRWLTAGAAGLSVTDGPYSEAKEVIGGFFMIEAADYDEAVSICSDCPHLKYGGRIELRQVDEMH